MMKEKGDDRSNRNRPGQKRKLSNDGVRQIMRLFLWISVYRIINVWIIRTQFDPDEYWQTLEPAYCPVFGPDDGTSHSTIKGTDQYLLDRRRMHYGCALTWEWTRRWTPPSNSSEMSRLNHLLSESLHGPVRSYVSVLPTYLYYLACRPLLNWAAECDESDKNINYGSPGPAFLHAVLVAAPTDLMVWVISSRLDSGQSSPIHHNHDGGWRQSWPFWALVCSLTSWFHGYALVRTYANSVESVMLMLGITLLGPVLSGQSQSGETHVRSSWRARFAFIIGGLSVCVRFTSLAAWIPIGLILVLRSTGNSKIRILLGLCTPFGLLGVLFGCCIDRWFYGFWAIPFLGNIHFNVLLGHGSLYGTHPFLWYAYAGIPAICGVMLPFFIWEISTIRSGPRSLLLWIIAPYIILHSFSEHKEFRFLLPVLPIICILVGHALSRLIGVMENTTPISPHPKKLFTPSNFILVALILLNFPHLLYLGLIHQRGPIATNQYLASFIEKETHQAIEGEAIRQYSIHYLMGCHSAPMYSHLHKPNARVEAWHLDCSPECRSNPDIICDSDSFLNDPLGFVMNAYNVGSLRGNIIREKPSFLVVMQDDAAKIGTFLTEKLKLSHAASIRHTIKSISWHQDQCDATNDGQCSLHEMQHYPLTLFSRIDIYFDHMEVYTS